jgi:hypothetical protein
MKLLAYGLVNKIKFLCTFRRFRAMVYRLYLIKDGKEIYYGSSTYVDYMSELIDDYVKTNGSSGENFSFKIEVSVR